MRRSMYVSRGFHSASFEMKIPARLEAQSLSLSYYAWLCAWFTYLSDGGAAREWVNAGLIGSWVEWIMQSCRQTIAARRRALGKRFLAGCARSKLKILHKQCNLGEMMGSVWNRGTLVWFRKFIWNYLSSLQNECFYINILKVIWKFCFILKLVQR